MRQTRISFVLLVIASLYMAALFQNCSPVDFGHRKTTQPPDVLSIVNEPVIPEEESGEWYQGVTFNENSVENCVGQSSKIKTLTQSQGFLL